jgi:probable F420-dependent oxidoreductase
MTWAAAATETIQVGSSIIILPQRNPVIFAKQISCLDEFSSGRVTLGIGVGWCKDEMEAVGADWVNRGKRTDEYLMVLRALWRNEVSEFHGETVSFSDAYMYPKPVRAGNVPIMIGGDTDIALRRVARAGDGWLAFHLPVETAASRVALLRQLTREQGRDPESLRISVAIFSWTELDDLKRYRDAGIKEFLLFKCGEMSIDDAELNDQMAETAHRYVDFVADW